MARGRKPSIRYWPSRGGYCCWINGKQEMLAQGPEDYPGPTYQAAFKRFGELLRLQTAHTAKDANTVQVVFEKYMEFISTRRHPSTVHLRHLLLRPFVDALGEVAISQLTQAMVYEWLDRMQEWRKHPRTGH